MSLSSRDLNDVSEQKRLQEQLITIRAQMEAFINNATVAFLVCDREGNLLRVNHTFTKLCGWSEQEAIGMTLPFVPDDQYDEFIKRLRLNHWEQGAYEAWRQRRDGSRFIASETITPIRGERGEIDSYAIVLRDITSRKQAEQRVQESQQRYKSLFEQNPDAIFSIDLAGRFQRVNPAMQNVSGYQADELLHKQFIAFLVPQDAGRALLQMESAQNSESYPLELAILHKNGQRVELSVSMMPIRIDEEIVGLFGIAKDITEQKQAEQLINHMAYHDSLTDLPNRRLFKDRLDLAVERAVMHREPAAILFIDLDRFKIINDSLGHAYGDLVLQTVAERINSCVRPCDLVARMGGDEFTLLLPNSSPEEVRRIAGDLLDAIKQPMPIGGHDLQITPSIGISFCPQDGTDADTLMKNADTAMYHAKELGKNNYQLFHRSMNSLALQRMELENELRKALERQEFLLHYQPQINIDNGRIIGMEALIRWKHPDRGLLAPAQFIPIAEETGLIVSIGEWVMRQACRDCKSWHDAGLPPLRVAVNLSMKQFHKHDLCDTVADVLTETGLLPRYLELEITESIAMHNTEQVVATLVELVNLGIEVSIDDFGTGFSSLSYLKKFPIHKLKIDRSFVSDITTDPDDESIVAAIVAMAHRLHLGLIVEGVETEEQQQHLHLLGCQEMQGFLFGRPVPAEEVPHLLEQQKR